jgi:hypothetical protein
MADQAAVPAMPVSPRHLTMRLTQLQCVAADSVRGTERRLVYEGMTSASPPDPQLRDHVRHGNAPE